MRFLVFAVFVRRPLRSRVAPRARQRPDSRRFAANVTCRSRLRRRRRRVDGRETNARNAGSRSRATKKRRLGKSARDEKNSALRADPAGRPPNVRNGIFSPNERAVVHSAAALPEAPQAAPGHLQERAPRRHLLGGCDAARRRGGEENAAVRVWVVMTRRFFFFGKSRLRRSRGCERRRGARRSSRAGYQTRPETRFERDT